MKKTGSWLLIFFLLLNVLTGMFITTAADPFSLELVTNTDQYKGYSFEKLDLVYTPDGLTHFDMPFIVTTPNRNYLKNSDLEHEINQLSKNKNNWDDRLINSGMDIVAQDDNIFVVNYWADITASNETFQIDIIPKIKNIRFPEYAWWSSEWSSAINWHISSDYIGETLTNFPVLVNISSTIAGECQADGGDIRFVNGANTTELYYEIELWDSSATSYVWVNVTSISSSSVTDFTMYYGNDGCDNGENPVNVWDSNYIYVSHMNGTVNDSTTFDRGSTTNACTEDAGGIIGYCQDIDSGYIDLGTKVTPLTSMTVEAWVNIETDGGLADIITSMYNTDSWSEIEFQFRMDANNFLYFETSSDSGHILEVGSDPITHLDTDEWEYMAGTWDGSVAYNFINDSQVHQDVTASGTMSNDVNAVTCIGAEKDAGAHRYNYDGLMDEVRISNISRSGHWTNATFYTCNMTIGFLWRDSVQSQSNPLEPSNFTVTNNDSTTIFLEWEYEDNATETVGEWNTISTWSRGSGTELFNYSVNSSLCYEHSGLTGVTIYYYQIWGFNDSTHGYSTPVLDNNVTTPGEVTGTTAVTDGADLNISWTTGLYSDKTQIVRKADSFPTSPTDGTVIHNGSGTSYTDTSILDAYRYTLFSFNTTVKQHSASGVDRAWGGLSVNVYDENTSEEITEWDIFISNNDGTDTYENLSNNNTLTIDIADLPYGEDCIIIVNKTNTTENYTSKTFIMDLEVNTNYELNVYLAEDTSTSQYIITVVGPQTDYGYEPPLQDVTVQFKRYINDSVGYQNVSILLTDASGIVSIDLIPHEHYLIIMSKTDYTTEYNLFTPPVIVYSEDRYHKFRMIPIPDSSIVTPLLSIDEFWQNITFTANMSLSGYLQDGNITIYYTDSNSSTTDTTTYLFETYNGTNTLVDSNSETLDSWIHNVGSINTTRYHYVELYFNNTATFDVTSPVTIAIFPKYIYPTIDANIDDRITNLIGPFRINDIVVPWGDIIGIIIPMLFLVSFGVYNTGIGILGMGISMGFMQVMLGGFGLNINTAFVILCPIIILIGVVYIMSKGQGGDKL